MPNYLIITLGKNGDYRLRFRLSKTKLTELWLERMQYRNSWQLDHRDRFYNFGSKEQEQQRATDMIQQCIAVINSYQPVIDRPFEYTQDCLNYLHNIFERYHGLLDQQTSPFWITAPDNVKKALAELNLAVHRCESVGAHPRFVCTWFGMPKTHTLAPEVQAQYGSCNINFGTVYLNYCEIGKTVENLAQDNDKYIGEDAFRPFSHYSADFNVQFHDRNLTEIYGSMQNYIDQHQAFFLTHGITSVHDIRAQPLRFPIAHLEYSTTREQLLFEIGQRQWIHDIDII